MPYMKEHINAGIIASLLVSGLLFVGYSRGFIPSLYSLFVLLLFGTIGIVIGSDLPDVDSRTAPIHEIFGLLTFAVITILSMVYLRLGNLLSLLTGFLSMGCYIQFMPRHRGFIHTIRAGLLLGGIGAVLLQILFHSIWLSFWMGFSLFLGHMVHLTMDNWLKL